MDNKRFDMLTRVLARRQNRRVAIWQVGATGVIASLIGRGVSTPAARAFPARQLDCPGYPWRECSGVCVNIENDPFNCGDCGIGCDAYCQGGSCASCGGVESLCGETCVDLQSNHDNCGSCGVICQRWEDCVAGSCFAEPVEPPPVGCSDGLTLCGGFCIDTQNDFENCGGCGRSCSMTLYVICRAGQCCDYIANCGVT